MKERPLDVHREAGLQPREQRLPALLVEASDEPDLESLGNRSGRMDLPPALAGLLTRIAESTAASGRPFITTVFGNPYVATMVSDLPAILLTYDLYDLPEASAVRAIAGETAVGGKLPITLPGLFPMGHGLERPVRSQGATSGR